MLVLCALGKNSKESLYLFSVDALLTTFPLKLIESVGVGQL